MRCLKMCHLAVHTHNKHVHTRYKSCQKMGHLDRDVLPKDVSSCRTHTKRTCTHTIQILPKDGSSWQYIHKHVHGSWTHIQRSPATCKFVCSFWIVMVLLNMSQIILCWYWTNWDQVTLGYICVRTSDELAQFTNLRSKTSKLFSRSSTSML